MKITLALIDKLIRLRNGESIPASSLHANWIEDLLQEGVLVSRSRGSQRSITAQFPDALEKYLERVDERLGNLDRMRNLLLNGTTTRSDQAADTGNSKLLAVRSCPGFPVNSYEPIPCMLDGKEITIAPQEGTFLFIADWQQFKVPEDVTIVNVENMENFRCIRQQRELFTSVLLDQSLLFVSRYPQSTDLRSWLQSIPNSYVHFGDFDLAGINIFLTEYKKHLGQRATFLIPEDIEHRLKHGSAERYDAQYQKFRNLHTDIQALQKLIDAIHKHRRCYDQEGYIAND
jgi:hypothetical protein